MKKTISLAIMLALVQFNFAQNMIKVVSSDITFKIKNAGLTVTGKFSGLESEIKFASENIKASSIKASIAVNTINTGIETRDSHLKKEEYFNASLFPKITLVSNFFGKDETKFKGYFKLTIKGITKDVVIPFTFENNIFSAEFTINRRDFMVGGNSLIMSDKVTIKVVLKTAS